MISDTPNQQPNLEGSIPNKTKATQTRFDYHNLLQVVEERGKTIYGRNFEIADIDRPVILKLLAYFLRDEAVAVDEGIDLDKGIMLTGPIGCGKTSLMTICRSLSFEPYRPIIISCRQVSIEFSHSGYDALKRYTNNSFYPWTSIPRNYCFDDLGLESRVTFWGNNTNVMAELLLSRYDYFMSHKMITHATTNLNSQELEDIYGNRLRSRMRAMFNLFAFSPETTDKRK